MQHPKQHHRQSNVKFIQTGLDNSYQTPIQLTLVATTLLSRANNVMEDF